jgi:heterotetrameric sarcosine oxidase gamma subunit
MGNQISAMHNHLPPQHVSPPSEGGIMLEEILTFSLFQFSGWPDTMAKTAQLVRQVAGSKRAVKSGRVAVAGKMSILRVEPLKYWLIAADALLEPATVPCDVCCALDLSHSKMWIKVSGHKAETLLNHFLPIDLRHGKFIEGDVVNTAFHHVGVTLWRTEECFNLLIPRSFAACLRGLLLASASQYGVNFKLEAIPEV